MIESPNWASVPRSPLNCEMHVAHGGDNVVAESRSFLGGFG